MDTVKYCGCFLDPQAVKKGLDGVLRNVLYRQIPDLHITFAYRPDSVPWDEMGKEVRVNVVGYGNDGENEALLVEFAEVPAGLQELAARIAVPHITLSVSREGRSVNSRWLEFTPIAPYTLTGIFGVMDEDGQVRT